MEYIWAHQGGFKIRVKIPVPGRIHTKSYPKNLIKRYETRAYKKGI